MSDVSVDIIKNRSGEAPDLPSGANLSGVSTAATLQVTNLNPTHINASGVTTATTFSGSMKSTGTPTLGLGVTINSSGINISGVATAGIVSATTLYGDGSNLTGVAMSIAPVSYQPDVNDTLVTKSGVSIGMTFTERVIAGSGNVTLRIAGAGGTVVENFGVGSSVTIANNTVLVTPTAALVNDTVYHISYPSGAFTNTAGDVSYVGTAYTFTAAPTEYQLWVWGENAYGQLGINEPETSDYSSPVQIPGTDWTTIGNGYNDASFMGALTSTGTLWMWGRNNYGQLAQNNTTNYSSPTQIPGTTWSFVTPNAVSTLATKTDGTLWAWGRNNNYGQLGQNNTTNYSSPVQIGGGTDWATGADKISCGLWTCAAIKTNGTLWVWGDNEGELGQNNKTDYSSPTQIPGTTWSTVTAAWGGMRAIKTDGTLWGWGFNNQGQMGDNKNFTVSGGVSSPIQIPGTTWKQAALQETVAVAVKTDGTLWAMGEGTVGQLGQNSGVKYSSPVQIPGTSWSDVRIGNYSNATVLAKRTDGTLWAWGGNYYGALGQNNITQYSSPVQIPGTDWYKISSGDHASYAIKEV